jgi:hypothetical protein
MDELADRDMIDEPSSPADLTVMAGADENAVDGGNTHRLATDGNWPVFQPNVT